MDMMDEAIAYVEYRFAVEGVSGEHLGIVIPVDEDATRDEESMTEVDAFARQEAMATCPGKIVTFVSRDIHTGLSVPDHIRLAVVEPGMGA